MVNHITTNNCYCFSFYPWKYFCLSCFVGYRRSILYTFEISFHRFHSSFIFLMCPHLMCVFSHTKILNFMFPHFENIMHHSTWKIWTFWRRIRSLLFTRRSLLSSSCVDYLWVVRNFTEAPHHLYIKILFGIKWHFLHHKRKVFSLPPQRIALIFAPHDAPHLVTRSHTHHFHFYSLFIFMKNFWSLLWVTLKKSEKCFGWIQLHRDAPQVN